MRTVTLKGGPADGFVIQSWGHEPITMILTRYAYAGTEHERHTYQNDGTYMGMENA